MDALEQARHDEDIAIEEAAFDAGFNGEEVAAVIPDGNTPDAAQQNANQETAEQEAARIAKAQADAAVALAAEQDKPMSRAEVQQLAESLAAAAASKVHDKAFGKIGELQQRIEQMKAVGARISPTAKTRLAADFPELAEMLFDGADDVTADTTIKPAAQQQHTLSTDDIRKAVEAETTQKLERRLLTRDHSDWEQVVVTPEFKGWMAKLPPQEQQALNTTWNADLVSRKLTEFKKFRVTQSDAFKAKQAKKMELKKRLEGALTPKGVSKAVGLTPSHLTDEEAAMEKAFSG